jgi:hypothetical protein
MAVAIVATPASADANSYCTVDEATAHNAGHVAGAEWSDAYELRVPALIQATRMLDAMFDWDGDVATQTQALGWPRFGACDRQGRLLPSDQVPQAIKNATAELARQLLSRDWSADLSAEVKGLASVKTGPVEVVYRDGATGKAIPDAVFHLVGDLGRARSRGLQAVPLARV